MESLIGRIPVTCRFVLIFAEICSKQTRKRVLGAQKYLRKWAGSLY